MLKTKSPIYLGLLFLTLSFSNLACSVGRKGEIISQEVSALTNHQLVDFKFEDFSVSDTEEVREKLRGAFPQGSDFDVFVETMNSLGAENRGGDDRTPSNQVYYYYESGTGLVKTVWIVGAKHDENRKIQEITVKSGGTGP